MTVKFVFQPVPPSTVLCSNFVGYTLLLGSTRLKITLSLWWGVQNISCAVMQNYLEKEPVQPFFLLSNGKVALNGRVTLNGLLVS